MSIRLTSSRHFVSILAALALTACASTPGAEMSITSTATAPRGDVDGVQALLMQGDIKGGKKQLKSLLEVYPMDPRLMLLQQSISKNPTELLGPASYPYTVRGSDTMEGLAERLLGNKLKAYQLARYNRLKTPAVLVRGQILRSPGGALSAKALLQLYAKLNLCGPQKQAPHRLAKRLLLRQSLPLSRQLQAEHVPQA